jgi:hypothetical protein
MTRTQRQIETVRKADACIQVLDLAQRPRPGVPVSVEQEGHGFVFGCVVPDLSAWSEPERRRYRDRLDDLFNRVVPAPLPPSEPRTVRWQLAERLPLAQLPRRLEQLAAAGNAIEVHVWGQAAGMDEAGDEREAGRRLAGLYALCFAQPAVRGVFWNGFADGEEGVRGGLLRADLAPKYGFRALHKLIHVDWHTRAAGRTDEAGMFRFRGFFGPYRLVVECAAGPRVETFTFCRGAPPPAAIVRC